MSDEPDRESAERRADAVALIPRLLVALAGACTLSGLVGFGMLLAGADAPPLPVLLAPPVIVLLVGVWIALRQSGAADG